MASSSTTITETGQGCVDDAHGSGADVPADESPAALIFDKGRKGRRGACLPELPENARGRKRIGADRLRDRPAELPEVSEPQAVRHYTRLSQKNYSIDTNFYPLGSCTMKYNPRACEAAAAMPGFTGLHPLQDASDSQGTLSVLYELQGYLAELVGLPHVSLAPTAGAQGEFAGIAIIKSWHKGRGSDRDTVLVPDSAHGTNPASAALCGYKVRTVASGPDGRIDLESLKAELNEKTAAIMLTNPNTCGVYENNIQQIARMVHETGALLYYDGANLNAILGRMRPGDSGFDVVHMNLHKTFSTPHGGGGPGAGPIAVREDLAPYLPWPRIVRKEDDSYSLDETGEESIGRLHAFHGNVGVLIRAYTYIRLQGAQGMRDISTHAVLNANYLMTLLAKTWRLAFDPPCKHEFIVTLKNEAKENGVKAFDVSKRLIDFGFHPPTNYFPLIVPECLLIEPTESETKQTLDAFAEAMEKIHAEILHNPDVLHRSPLTAPIGRVDEVAAARQINVCCLSAVDASD